MIQGSQEWKMQRLGQVTASRICDVMAKIKSGEAAARRDYRIQLATEIISGQPTESYQSAEMIWGIEMELVARAAYEFRTGVEIEQVGYIHHPTIQGTGASPDGLEGETGLIEIKCPKTATHISYLLSDAVPKEYVLQMQWQMECTGREWCDFVSFDPRVVERLQLVRRRVYRDEALIQSIQAEVRDFIASLHHEVARIESAIAWSNI